MNAIILQVTDKIDKLPEDGATLDSLTVENNPQELQFSLTREGDEYYLDITA